MVDNTPLKMEECTQEYWDFVLILRNQLKKGFLQQEDIVADDHYRFMKDKAKFYMICTHSGIPAGFVGQVDGDIRVATHPDYQGVGVGKYMINELMKKWPDSSATVKIENHASLALFESCGFKKKCFVLEKCDA